MLKKIIKIIITAVSLAIGLTVMVIVIRAGQAAYNRRQAEKPAPADPPPVNVEVLKLRTVPEVEDVLDLPAVVEANSVVDVAAEVAGRIERIAYKEGAEVVQGDTIIYLNTDLLKAERDRAQADWAYAQKQYERLAQLAQQGVETADARDRALATLQMRRADLELCRARLQRAEIPSPVGGILNQVPVDAGEYVKVGDLVAQIVDADTVKVVVQAPERDVQYFSAGQNVQVDLDLDGVRRMTGLITYISELADPLTRSTRMEITVPNKPHVLRGGRIVKARLVRRALGNVIMIPLAAVVPMESGYEVYVVEGDKARRRAVDLGLKVGLVVQVSRGLSPGELLIVAGYRFVGDGDRVRVVAERDVEAPLTPEKAP
jgi:membrane fusion protein (multidrug efflux system)